MKVGDLVKYNPQPTKYQPLSQYEKLKAGDIGIIVYNEQSMYNMVRVLVYGRVSWYSEHAFEKINKTGERK